MSRKNKSERPKKVDRRVRHTRNALGDALLELMQENKFSEITVQQVLDRAGVGRSTFYQHYEDKEDLFLSDLEQFLETFSMLLIAHKDESTRVAPVREFLEHVGEMRHVHAAIAAADKLHDFQDMAEESFARAIRKRLEMRSAGSRQIAATAHALAGALVSTSMWWLQSGATESPEEMDAWFHRVVCAGVITALPSVQTREEKTIPVPSRSMRLQRQGLSRRTERKSPRG